LLLSTCRPSYARPIQIETTEVNIGLHGTQMPGMGLEYPLKPRPFSGRNSKPSNHHLELIHQPQRSS
jgi:hypothetical protein